MTVGTLVRLFISGALLVAAGCTSADGLIDKAKTAAASGKPLVAIELLREAEIKAQGTPGLAKAAELRAEIMAQQAVAAIEPRLRSRLMRAALQLAPDSGVVWANACVGVAFAGNFEQLRSCLETLKLKKNVPDSVAAGPRSELAAHDEEVERRRLLASEDEQNWRSLVAKYPTTAESQLAAEKLKAAESVCSDAARLDPAPALAALVSLAQFAHEMEGSRQELETFMTVAGNLDALASTVVREVINHAIKPGEERARQLLDQDHFALKAAFSGWMNAVNESGGSAEVRSQLSADSFQARIGSDTTERIAVCLEMNSSFEAPKPSASSVRRWADALRPLTFQGK